MGEKKEKYSIFANLTDNILASSKVKYILKLNIFCFFSLLVIAN